MKQTIISNSIETKILAEAIVFIALANVLYITSKLYFPFLRLPQGGRVTLAPTQILLDYPLAFGALGLAGAFKKQPVIGVGIGILGRFICHFISGVIFFGQYAWEGWNVIAYSAAYNATYLVPEFIVSAIIIFTLLKRDLLNIYM